MQKKKDKVDQSLRNILFISLYLYILETFL